MQNHYPYQWANEVFDNYIQIRPRGPLLLMKILGITKNQVIKLIQKDGVRWENFKKSCKQLENWIIMKNWEGLQKDEEFIRLYLTSIKSFGYLNDKFDVNKHMLSRLDFDLCYN